MSQLTPTEARLVEQYVSVLDYVSRCAQAIDHGDWFYLYDKAGSLAVQAERLSEIAREAYDAPRRPRKQAVGAAVVWFGRHYRAARLLHPLPDPRGGWGAVRLRLHGTPAEVATALPLLAACFEVVDQSRPYPDRPPSRLVRVYLDPRLPALPAPGHQVAGDRHKEAPLA